MNRNSKPTSDKPLKRNVCWSLIAIVLAGFTTQKAEACTSFAMDCQDGLLFGANFDNNFRPGSLYVNKRGVSKKGWPMDEHDTPAVWTSKYGSVTIHTAPYQYAWAGINEAGLVISTMQLDETEVPPPDSRPSLLSAAWVQFVLDTCASVDEIILAEKQVRLNYGVDHYLACDATGECLTIEFLEGKPEYHRNKDLPIKALHAGMTYAHCINHRPAGAASSSNASISSPRISRINEMFRAYDPKGATQGVEYAFGILKEVSAPNTTWSLVFDLSKRAMFFRTYKNKRVRHIALSDLDFSCRTPVMTLDVHSSLSGDILKHLEEYSHDATLRHALEAVAFHRPDIPEETVQQMVRHMESFACTDAD